MSGEKIAPVPIPDSLFYYPCDPVAPGKTKSSLARAYVKNTTCIGEYKITIDGIKEYNDKLKQLKNGEEGGM